MAASYPTSVRSFTTKVNIVDTIEAAHPNSLQDEVIAIESVIGTDPSVATAATASGWANTATDYLTIKARLANIEKGIVADTHTQYVKNTGGSTITSSAASVVGLAVKGAVSQSANLQEWKNNSGTTLAYVDASGNLVANTVTSSGGSDAILTNLMLGGM